MKTAAERDAPETAVMDSRSACAITGVEMTARDAGAMPSEKVTAARGMSDCCRTMPREGALVGETEMEDVSETVKVGAADADAEPEDVAEADAVRDRVRVVEFDAKAELEADAEADDETDAVTEPVRVRVRVEEGVMGAFAVTEEDGVLEGSEVLLMLARALLLTRALRDAVDTSEALGMPVTVLEVDDVAEASRVGGAVAYAEAVYGSAGQLGGI